MYLPESTIVFCLLASDLTTRLDSEGDECACGNTANISASWCNFSAISREVRAGLDLESGLKNGLGCHSSHW